MASRLLKEGQALPFAILSIIFTIWYCKFIFLPSNIMVGANISDAYQLFGAFHVNYSILQSGNFPFGVYWVPNLIGGSIGTWSYISFIPDIAGSICLLFITFFKDPVLAMKILEFIILLIAQFCSYKLAKFYLRKTWIAWIFSISYAFSAFYFGQVNDGHITFIMGAALLPATFLLFEKMLLFQNRKSMFFASLGVILLFFADVQITIFSLFYIFLRLGYHLIVNRKNIKIDLIKRLLELSILVSLFVAPFVLIFLNLQNIGALSVPPGSIQPRYVIQTSDLFLRGFGEYRGDSLMATSYLGIILFVISLVPMLVFRTQSKHDTRNYLFHWIGMIFFVLVAIGTPLQSLVTTFFVRVPDRALSLIIFCFCVCAGYGLLCLSNLFSGKSKRFSWVIKSKPVKTLLIVGLATAIFADLTFGMQPLTSAVPQLTSGEKFVKGQNGDFRLLSYPTVWGIANYKATLTNHEIVGTPVMGLRAYPPNNALFSELSTCFGRISTAKYNQTASSWDINASKLTALSTLCGVKYVTIEKNQSQSLVYINYFGNSTKYFTEVFNGNDSVVYENRFFQGVAFAVKANGYLPAGLNIKIDEISRFNLSYIIENLTVEDLSSITMSNAQIDYDQEYNKIHLSINISEAAYLVLCQAYYPHWIVTNNGIETSQFRPLFNVTGLHLDKGNYNLTAVFAVAYQANMLYIGAFISLLFVCVILYADTKRKNNLLNFSSGALIAFGILLIFLVYGVGFGIFNKLLLGLGIVDISLIIIILFSRKTKSFFSVFSQGSDKSLTFGNRQVTLTSLSPNKAHALSGVFDKFIKLLVVVIVTFVLIANVVSLPEMINWLNESMLFSLFLVISIYAIKVEYLECKSGNLPVTSPISGASKEKSTIKIRNKIESLLGGNIRHLHSGVLGGVLGICIAGLSLRAIALYTGEFMGQALVLCGALGGTGFGALTSGNNRLRGLLGALFGIFTIIVGLIITYTSPVIIGYQMSTSGDLSIPIYKWQQYTFARFLELEMLRLNTLYYAFIGIFIAYLTGSYLSRRDKFNMLSEALQQN